jgi:monovalent cation:proton antiporter-2 (CPA2) family protein
MEEFHAIPYLREIVIILAAAGILVPLFSRFKVSPVLGYLAVGFIVGPFGLGSLATAQDSWLSQVTIGNANDVAHLAEFGIVFLMFMIGLELSPARLWAMRRMVFGLGALQVVLCILAIGGISWAFFGKSIEASLVIGACLALSSTAIVMQILSDRHLTATPLGRSCFSILLFQDLAVVPILILVGLLGAGTSAGMGMVILLSLGKAIAAVAVLLIIGHYVLRPIFRLAGGSSNAEPFMAVTFLTVIVTAAITGVAGLSMALGAFLGGILLAETEYRHAIEVYIEPFKGLLLGLFFMTVGMGIDPGMIRLDVMWICISVVGLLALKALIISGLGLMFGLSRGVAIQTGLMLGQAGEFAFVILGTAIGLKLISEPFGQFLLVVTGISMILTPFMAMAGTKLGTWLDKDKAVTLIPDAPESIPQMQHHILLAGFGRVGRAIAQILDAEGIPYLALETDTEIITEQRQAGQSVIYGDASRKDMLKHFHPELASAIVVTMSDLTLAEHTVKNIRENWPNIPVFSRATDLKSAKQLNKAGSTTVVAETIEASLQLASTLLRGIGTNEDIVLRRLELSREYAMNRITED